MSAAEIGCFQDMASALVRTVPKGWQKAWVTTHVDDGLSESIFDYVDLDGNEQWFDPDTAASAAIGRSMRDLQAIMRNDAGHPWSSATFAIFPDGQFKFDAKYHD